MRVSIIVPTFAGAELLARHLPDVCAEAVEVAGGAEVIVVDDGSPGGGGEIAAVAAALGSAVRVVRRSANGGFAAAVNEGVAAARGECVLLLNDDMRVEPGCLAALLDALDSRPELFAVTPVILNLAEGFVESTTALRFHRGVFDVVLPGRAGAAPAAAGAVREIAFACGGALLCRRDELVALGGSDAAARAVLLGGRRPRLARALRRAGDRRVRRRPRPPRARAHHRPAPAGAGAPHLRAQPPAVHLAAPRRRERLGAPPAVAAAPCPRRARAPRRRRGGLPLALVWLPAVAAARRRARPARARSAALLRDVIAGGSAGWPRFSPRA